MINSVINMSEMGVHSTNETGFENFDSTSIIQNVIDNTISGTLVFEGLPRVLISKPIIIHDGIKIKSTANTEFYTNKSGNDMPNSFFYIKGNNVELDGIMININKSQLNTSSKGRGIEISTTIKSIPDVPSDNEASSGGDPSQHPTPGLITPSITTDIGNITIKNCVLTNCFYGILCYDTRIWNVKIINNTINSCRQDIIFNNIGGRGIEIYGNRFLVPKDQSTPCYFAGNITICSGYHFPCQNFQEVYNNETYESKRFKDIRIKDNQFYQISDRAVRIINAIDVTIENNTVDNKPWGDASQLGYSDDVMSFDFCSTLRILNNTINYSGESLIDILSCNDVKIIGNTLTGADDNGIGIGTSDIFDLWYTVNLNADYLNCKDIIISNNKIGAKYCCIDIRLGNNITITGNQLFTYPDKNANGIHLGLVPFVNALTDIPRKRHLYNAYSLSTYPQLKLKNIKCADNMVTDKSPNVYFGPSPVDYVKNYFVWGTIELGEDLAIYNDFLVNSNDTITFVHFKGFYKNCKTYIWIDPNWETMLYANAQTLPSDRWVEVGGSYTISENGQVYTRGIQKIWQDANQIALKCGSSLADVPTRDSDIGAKFYTIARAWIRVKIF